MKHRFITGLLALAMQATTAHAADLNSVGVSVGSLGNPFFTAISQGVEKTAKSINPNVRVTVVASDYDLSKQQQQIDNFIAAGANLIVLDAVDPKAITPAIKRARAAGIVVVGVDEEADGEDAIFMTDNVQAGEVSCGFLADRLGGKGEIVILNGPQVSSVVARIKGCRQALEKTPGIKVLSFDQDAKGSRDGGLSVMQSLMTRYPKIDAVFAINDPSAIGASLAMRQLGRTDFFITSVDGSPDIEDAIKNPQTRILASSSQDPYAMAEKAVKAGYDLLNGKTVEPVKTLIPATLVTSENVATYKGWTAAR